jgi:hypothetical protein
LRQLFLLKITSQRYFSKVFVCSASLKFMDPFIYRLKW